MGALNNLSPFATLWLIVTAALLALALWVAYDQRTLGHLVAPVVLVICLVSEWLWFASRGSKASK